jgi:subtilase family serine protease
MRFSESASRTPVAPQILSMTLVLLFVGGFSGAVALSAGAAVATAALGAHPDLVAGPIHPMLTEKCSASGFCPTQVQSAYSFTSLLANSTMNGTGQSIDIVDACGDSAIAADVATFDSLNKLPAISLTVYQPQGAPCSDPTGWGVETALDVEWAHAMAPGASIHLIEAKSASNANLFGAWNYSLKHHLGSVISNSWGGNGACSSSPAYLVAQAAKAGVTILASAGDSGAWGSGQRLAAQEPADCAAVVTVGGTTLKLGTSGGYSSESAWSGGGGGYVPKTSEPSYQSTDNITDSYAELGKPDVAAVANPSTGVWIYEKASGGWFVVGGTSVACPIWAAFLADVNSWRAANSFGGVGSVNSFLYSSIYGVNGGSANYTVAFHDVTTGSNGWSAGTGWDAATGIGSFIAYPLANLLANNAAA